MKSKQIVFLINSLDGGGAERVASTLLNHFSNDYECHLILMENIISFNLDKRINIIHLSENLNHIGIIKFLRLPIIAFKLHNIIKKNKFKQVVSFLHRANFINVIAKLFSRHRVVISERIAPSSIYSGNSMTSLAGKFLIKTLYKRADLIISASKAIKIDLKNNFNTNIDNQVIYNPYDYKKINLLSKQVISIAIEKDKSIITVGGLSKRKNHKMLINAFSKINDKAYKLYILGKGNERIMLERLIKQLNIENRVIFLGFDKNPYKYLSKCGIFISSSNGEGFPNVLVEAMACGCSVISTDCLSGPREILAPSSSLENLLKGQIEKAEYGILTPINDEINLIDAINEYSQNADLRYFYSNKSKKMLDNFSISKIGESYLKVVFS